MKPRHRKRFVRGWLPKEASLAYASKTPKPRWRNPLWITFGLVVAVALGALVFFGIRTYMHYSNPAIDVAPSPYYEKTTNSTAVRVGDVVEVNVWVHWHGYVLPEFKRNVKIIDPFPESYFSLAGENETNVYESKGYGGTDHLEYLLIVVSGEDASAEFPAPRLYLDGVEIPLSGASPTVNIAAK
jgi:hypothetical protein